MNNRKIDARLAVPGTPTETTLTDRQQQLTQLLFKHIEAFRAEVYDVNPLMLVFDCERVLATVTEAILKGRYRGPAEDEAFLTYGVRAVRKETLRYKITADILAIHSRLIHRAIHQSLPRGIEERYIETSDVYWEIALLIFERAHSLAKRGKARLSTRLWALTAKHCRDYYAKKWSRRHRLNREHVAAGLSYGMPVMTSEEMASERIENSCV